MLKSLDEHNKEMRWGLKDPPNGIKCPECEKNGNIVELVDALRAPVVLTHPPQIQIYCNECQFVDWRVG
jgi:hypothetical protein